MGGLFGVVSKNDCVTDVFFGTDYHSHLGTKRGGMATYCERGFMRSIHNIENSLFRTKFERDVVEMEGKYGIGCISDNEPQPLLIRSVHGSYAIATVGRVDNMDELVNWMLYSSSVHFQEMSSDRINQTELIATLINMKNNFADGIRYAQKKIKGSISILLLTEDGIYAARDAFGRTPLMIAKRKDAFCVASESFSYLNLGYEDYKELGAGEIVYISEKGVKTIYEPNKNMKICAFLWTYFGYPTSSYEGVNVEQMRYNCGKKLAESDGDIDVDIIAGVPDSGMGHAIGYSNVSSTPFARPFIKYTPTWPRSFTPSDQKTRNLIAKMKLIPILNLIKDKKILLIDDSIVRGTQLRETVDFLYKSGAKEVHVRPACPPILYGCKYLNFSRSNNAMDLITRKIIKSIEGDASDMTAQKYTDESSGEYAEMVEKLREEQNFTTLRFQKLDDMLDAIGIGRDKICTYCWTGKE